MQRLLGGDLDLERALLEALVLLKLDGQRITVLVVGILGYCI